ncbi:MAG: O-methyltransferase [Planctomycetota bacterium]|jgi:predicted O-methyltransferase YrrM
MKPTPDNWTQTAHSHLPILARYIEDRKPGSALEFGVGEGSTPLLWKNCFRVVSLEMNPSDEWFMRVSCEAPNYWAGHHLPGLTSAIEWVKCCREKFDLVLVDGHGDSRPEQCQAATGVLNAGGIIAIHDTETASYGWDRLWLWLLEHGWQWTDYPLENAPTTTIVERFE